LTALCLVAATPTATAGDQQWGNIKGRIVWGKDIPKRKPLESVKANADKDHCLSNGPLLDEKWVVDAKDKGLRWTFVWLAPLDPKGGKSLPVHPSLQKINGPVVLDQPLCTFTPHALGIREGQLLVVKNPAPISHNFKYGGHPEFNPGNNILMPANSQITIKDLKAHRIPVKIECNIHPWMNGWVRVFNHPYFAVTDEHGNFKLKNVPAGQFRVMIWHGSGGFLGGAAGRDGQVVIIDGGKTKNLGNLEYTPPPP